LELTKRGISFHCQKTIDVYYDSRVVGTHVLDLLVENTIVVELKAVKALDVIHFAQLRSYARAAAVEIGLLLNFNSPTLEIRRIDT
jgi:GxxExxY protein